jgi:aminomethyltransferase
MVAFGGWEMPLEYGQGTVREHMECRRHCVVFDVSHLGTVRLAGPGAYETLQHALTNDLARIGPGHAQYTHLLDEDGSVLDDLIVWWVEPERFDVMPNASNTSRVLGALGGTDVTAERAILAVQGPEARELLAKVFPEAAEVPRFGVRVLSWPSALRDGASPGGAQVVVAGTGYTGEDGVELAVPADTHGGRPALAGAMWDALLGAGAFPAGLGARDTLRLEAGLPLHGHELGPGITPPEAGLSWVVAWDKAGGFRGLDALVARREAELRGARPGGPPAARRLKGIVGYSRQPFRSGYPVVINGTTSGQLTSGNFSPVLERGIGMAFFSFDIEEGAAVEIEARGRRLPGHVVKLPFVRH